MRSSCSSGKVEGGASGAPPSSFLVFPLSNRGGNDSPPRRSDVDFIVKHSRERLTQKPPAASYYAPTPGRAIGIDPAIDADQR